MINLGNFLEKKYKGSDISSIDLISVDIITSPRHSLMGVVLHKDLLILNTKYFYSFRLKLQNRGFLSHLELFKYKQLIDKDYLENYFFQNNDNPYALYNVMICVANGKPLNNLTQLPPLYLKKDINKQKEEIDKMHSKAQIGDTVCTFNRTSGISRLIRKVDRGMWSHVGMVNSDKKIYEITTSGQVVSEFSNLYNPFLDVALYRLKDVKLSFYEEEKLQKILDDNLKKQIQFNWMGIFLVFLHKQFGIPVNHGPTPSNLIYSNIFELIAYA